MGTKKNDGWEVTYSMPRELRDMYFEHFMQSMNNGTSYVDEDDDEDEDDEDEYFSSEHLGTSVPLSKLYDCLKDEFEHVSEIESLCDRININLEDYYGCPAISYDGIMKVLDEKLRPKLNVFSSLKVWDEKLACDNHIKILTRISVLRANIRKAFEEQEKFDKWLEEEQKKL